MVSTRQSSNVGSGSEGSGTELGHHGSTLHSRSVRSTLMSTEVSYASSSSSSSVGSSCSSSSVGSSSSCCSVGSSSSISSGGSSPRSSAVESNCSWSLNDSSCREVAVYQKQPDSNLLDMPPEILEKIFSYLGYQKVAQIRLVCKQLDQVCCNILNSTFQRLQTTMLNLFQTIRAKMPRRESARRNHPLACESDIVETLHMRLTLLQMTFGKHIERKHCCFFAGEILDEVYRILHYIKVTPKLSRPYKITDELFDLSSMAMEYFKEHIEPTLPEISCFGTDFLDFSKSFSDQDRKASGPRRDAHDVHDVHDVHDGAGSGEARAQLAQVARAAQAAQAAQAKVVDVNSRVIVTRARAADAQRMAAAVKTRVEQVRAKAVQQVEALRRLAQALRLHDNHDEDGDQA